MKSKIEQYKDELADLMETKNDPNTPKDIKNAIEPAIEKVKKMIKDEEAKGEKPSESKVSKAKEAVKKIVEKKAAKAEKKSAPAKKSSSALERCKEIIAKYRDKKKADVKRVEKRRKAGKPAELTPAETINKAAKSVKAKVVEMDKGLKVSEETSIINGIISSAVSAMAGIKDAHRKKMFIGKIIEGLRKLEKNLGMKRAEDGMYLHEIDENFKDDNAEMLRLNVVEIEHHVNEIKEALKSGVEVEGWVLSRSVRAKTDMSDITHYLDSSLKADSMADGGETKGRFGYIASYKGKRVEIYAETPYEAQLKAAKMLNAKKSYDVNVRLAEVDGKPYSYADGGYMARGGGIYSSDDLYILKVFDGETGELLDMSRRIWARNLKEADRIAKEDFEYEMKQKYGDYLRFRVEEAPKFAEDGGYMADGGEIAKTWKQLISKGYKFIGNDYSHLDSSQRLDFNKNVGDWEVVAKDKNIKLIASPNSKLFYRIFDKHMADGGYMAKGGDIQPNYRIGDVIGPVDGQFKYLVVDFVGYKTLLLDEQYNTSTERTSVYANKIENRTWKVFDGGMNAQKRFAREQQMMENGGYMDDGGGVNYPTDLKVGSIIKGVGFPMLKGIDGDKYYKVVELDDYSATFVLTDSNGKRTGSKKVRHYLSSIDGKIRTASRGDNNGIKVIKYKDGGYMAHGGLLEKVSEDWGKDSDLYGELEEAMIGWSDRHGELTPKGKIAVKNILINYDVLEDYEDLLENDKMAKGGDTDKGMKPLSYYKYEIPSVTIIWKGKTQPYGRFNSAEAALDVIKDISKTKSEENEYQIRTPDGLLNVSDYNNVSNGEMAKGGDLQEDKKLDLLQDEIKKIGINSFKTLDISKKPYISISVQDAYLEQIAIHIDSKGNYEVVNFYMDGDGEKDKSFSSMKGVINYLSNMKKEDDISPKEKKVEKNDTFLSPRDRFKKYGYADGGEMAKKGRLLSAINRDRAYKSDEEWEKGYKRKARPKNPKYNTSYALGGQAPAKQYPSLSDNKANLIN